ncbi:thiamine diphosphokinase [Peptoniphilus sp. MSJ-1]|uniref:Thiamine diphosphokinase n=1 Tax=Peptoniphilus ovalis TaxID=2841503 RepID=A0ABS6FG09_9FIRM|nr:thiamine diphosphokinase [Peptoniphilus ovalis]MBU5669114.1 thiamine diphosphokinase [Peptoniphilus ovalis]
MKKAVLITGGREISKKLLEKYSDRYKIVADSGANSLNKHKLKCDLLFGDLDSIDEDSLNYIKENNIEIKKFPPMKNLTDTEICIEFLIENDFKDIVILGGLGTRLDHELANIFLLKKLFKNNINGKIEDSHNEVIYAEVGEYKLKKDDKKYVSVINVSDEISYSTKGMLYEVDDLIINYENPGRGVSNEIKNESAKIKINKGEAFIIKSKD